jgi:hypothetical protein
MTRRLLALTACFVATYGFLVYASKAEPTPIREPLVSLPLTVGEWRGTVQPPLSDSVLAVLGLDDYTLRAYSRPGSSVNLYVGKCKDPFWPSAMSPRRCGGFR